MIKTPALPGGCQELIFLYRLMFYMFECENVQKLFCPFCLRMVKKCLRIRILHNFSTLQENNTVCDSTGKLHLVSNNEHSFSPAQPAEA